MPYFANGTQISEEDLRMLLVVDVGNTNIVAGVFEDKTLKVHWRFSTDRSKTADEFGIMLRSMFAYSDVEMDKISSVIISSVVPPVLIPLCHMCERYFGIKPMVVGPGVKNGIFIKYDNPKEVGADRIVNAVAAFHKFSHLGRPMIIIDFGTAKPSVLCCRQVNIWAVLLRPASAFLQKRSSNVRQSCRVSSSLSLNP